jgi:hypothetical protein
MRQEVPQFIDVEDKVIGPLSFRQFIYLVGGAGLGYLGWRVVGMPFRLILAPIGPALGLALAFWKQNGRPFLEVAQNYLRFQLKGKLYLWRHIPKKAKVIEQPKIDPSAMPQRAKPSIESLARNLDILDRTRE